jgi:hypothetical protein
MRKELASDTFILKEYITDSDQNKDAVADFTHDLNTLTFREYEIFQCKERPYNSSYYFLVMFRVSTTYNEKVAIQNTSINISGTI